MSSRQCRGGGGSSSGASVSLISSPQTLHRYLTLTLRISPEGGGGGIGVVKLRSRPIPLFHRTRPIARPATSQMMVDRAGINLQATPEVRSARPASTSLNQPRSGGDRVVGGQPVDDVCRVDALLSGFVEQRADARQFVGGVDAIAQRIGAGDSGAGRGARSWAKPCRCS